MEKVILRKPSISVSSVFALASLFTAIIALIVILGYYEEQEWQVFAKDNGCIVVSKRMPGPHDYTHRDEDVHETDIFDTGIRTTWSCNNDRTYVR